jgi:hypothetical protein
VNNLANLGTASTKRTINGGFSETVNTYFAMQLLIRRCFAMLTDSLRRLVYRVPVFCSVF